MIARLDKDWKKIITFLVLMAVVCAIFNTLIILNGGNIEENIPYAAVLIFSPAVISLLVNLLYEKNVRGFGWRWQRTKWQLVSYVVPVVYIAVAYGLVLAAGYAGLDQQRISELGWLGILMIPTLGLTGVLPQVLGEEVGWRGFLLNNLYKKMDFGKASLITGVVWALFHYPLLVMGSYNNGATPAWFALLFFTIAILGANTIINWLYIRSGSLWTAVIFHTVHNSLLNDLDPLIADSAVTPYLLTEFGAVLAIAILIVALYFWRRRDELPAPELDWLEKTKAGQPIG